MPRLDLPLAMNTGASSIELQIKKEKKQSWNVNFIAKSDIKLFVAVYLLLSLPAGLFPEYTSTPWWNFRCHEKRIIIGIILWSPTNKNVARWMHTLQYILYNSLLRFCSGLASFREHSNTLLTRVSCLLYFWRVAKMSLYSKNHHLPIITYRCYR